MPFPFWECENSYVYLETSRLKFLAVIRMSDVSKRVYRIRERIMDASISRTHRPFRMWHTQCAWQKISIVNAKFVFRVSKGETVKRWRAPLRRAIGIAANY
jgi:hypothetical protein